MTSRRNLVAFSWHRHVSILCLAVGTSGCQAARVVTTQCESPYVSGAATLDVTDGGSSRQITLGGEGGRTGSNRFDLVRAALLDGSAAADTGITWALATTDGTHLVVTHRTQLSAGARLTVEGPPGRRDWGIGPAPRSGAALVALVLPGAPAGTATTGTIEVLRTAPVEVRLALQAGQATVAGTARFRRAAEDRPCFS